MGVNPRFELSKRFVPELLEIEGTLDFYRFFRYSDTAEAVAAAKQVRELMIHTVFPVLLSIERADQSDISAPE
jgi:hypothetical protein